MTATNAEIEAEMKLRAFGESISAIYKSEYEVDEAVVAVIPSAPSPASMPEVLATDVVKYDIRCIKEKDSILLKIKDNITNRDYRITIHGKDNDIGWSSFKKYYQNDFEKFYQSLELCIEGNTNGLTCNIIEAQNEVIMEIKSSIGLFIWHYSHQIVVPIEENEVEVLKNKNEELVNRLNEMEKKMNDLFEFIDLWITGKPVCVPGWSNNKDKGTFISNEGTKWENQIPFKISEYIYVFGGSEGGWFKMSSVDYNGNFIENRHTISLKSHPCNSIEELTIEIWNSARKGGDYKVEDIILEPVGTTISIGNANPQLWSNIKKLRNWEF